MLGASVKKKKKKTICYITTEKKNKKRRIHAQNNTFASPDTHQRFGLQKSCFLADASQEIE